jgi:iron(III) transport system substrate-binding protein
MPNPKSSGTGYTFLKSLVNAWGEDKALDYFNKLSENMLHFTTSGAGPINDIIAGEAAIGLAMTHQAVTEINNGVDIKMVYFKEGAPYTFYGMGIVEGKQDKKAVREVFNYFIEVLIPKDKELFLPEKMYKDRDFTIENYPTDIKYADMTGNTAEAKTLLLEKWDQ